MNEANGEFVVGACEGHGRSEGAKPKHGHKYVVSKLVKPQDMCDTYVSPTSPLHPGGPEEGVAITDEFSLEDHPED